MHRAAQGGAKQIAHADDLAVEVDLLRLEPLLAREGKELRNEFRSPLGSCADQLDTFPIAGFAQIACQQVRVGKHDGKQIVEIVCYTGRNLPDRVQPLQLLDFGFGELPLLDLSAQPSVDLFQFVRSRFNAALERSFDIFAVGASSATP